LGIPNIGLAEAFPNFTIPEQSDAVSPLIVKLVTLGKSLIWQARKKVVQGGN
jgi:hypothetical protein